MKKSNLFSYLLMCVPAIALAVYCYALPQPKVYSRHRLSPELQARVKRANQLFKQGQQERRLGDLTDAEADLKACLAEDTGANQLARQELAQIYEAEGRTNDAIQVYQTMLHPPANEGHGGTVAQDGFTLIHYAMALNKAGHWPEAMQAYEASLSNPNMPDSQENLSADAPRIETDFNPTVPQQNKMAAMLHVVLGRRFGHNYADALPEFEAATAIDPNLAIAYYYTGYALQGEGHHTEAQVAFRKAIRLDTEGTVKAAAQKELPAATISR